MFVWASSRPLNKGCIKGRRKKKVVILAERPAKGQPTATPGLNGVFSQKARETNLKVSKLIIYLGQRTD